MKNSRPHVALWLAGATALWAAVFAAFHIIWAAGWYPLLNAAEARVAFATPWTWAFDAVVAVMCVIAVPVALAPVMSWGRRVPRRLITTLAWTGTALLVFRATASLAQSGFLLATGRLHIADLSVWEPWFWVGAILFTLTTWRANRVNEFPQRQ